MGLLESVEPVEGGEEVALNGVEAPLNAGVVAADEFAVIDRGFGVAALLEVPVIGFDPRVAAEEPFVADDDIDEGAFLGSGGEVLSGELVREGVEIFGEFTRENFGFGIDAGFECVHAGGVLAFRGAGSGGLLSVSAVGGDLLGGGHGAIPGLTVADGPAGFRGRGGELIEG